MSPTERMLKWFECAHLPEHLQDIVLPIRSLAITMATIPPSAELTAGLRKLLEAKDCFVRAQIEATAKSE